jgi:hypothetical protein
MARVDSPPRTRSHACRTLDLITTSVRPQARFIEPRGADRYGGRSQLQEIPMTRLVLATSSLVLLLPSIAAAQFAEPDVQVRYSLVGEAAGDSFGYVGEAIGDIDGDRADDFVIGAPFNDAGGTNAGRAYVYSGRTGAVLHTVTGDAATQRLGFSLAGPGDLDDDRVPDYVVGGVGGRVVALSGADHHVLFDVRVPGEAFGFDLGTAGDVDLDGTPDLVVGAFAAEALAGRIYVLSGTDGGVLWFRKGPNPGAGLGQGVSGIDDLDGDGAPEVVGSAPGAGPTFLGASFIYSGADGTPLRQLDPDPTALSFGTYFTHDAGDVDRDGVGDILISDFADTEGGVNAGKSYVFSGATGDRLWVFLGEANDGFGIGRGIGDIDRDHHADLILAAYTSSAGAFQGGQVRLYSGKDGDVVRTFTGTVAGAQLGFDALAIGDVNCDRATDFLITGLEVAHVVAGRRHRGHGHGHGGHGHGHGHGGH